jgi:glutamate-1-semialdehyde aminotransferase
VAGVEFTNSRRLLERAKATDAWAATRDSILEIDESNLAYPVYFERAEGAHVRDVDGNGYLDYVLGYGPVVLGHARPEIERVVVEQLRKGVCASPLWNARQFELTELLCEVIPAAEQAYLMRTGSDATAAAVRLARIHTGRSHVIKWGYNGWHDWTAPRPAGVPAATLAQTSGFEFNDLESLRAAFAAHDGDVACVIMMSYGTDEAEPGFLQSVIDLAHAHGALFVLDEMRSGFRMALGGAQEYFGITPDLSTFSKAMANGYPVSAVVGRRDVMAGLGRSHMSSTFYGNPAEMAAAIACIELLRAEETSKHLWTLGTQFVEGFAAAVAETGFPAAVVGYPISPYLEFPNEDTATGKALKSTFYAETIRNGILLHPNHQWYLSGAHTEQDVALTVEVARAAMRTALEQAP